MYESLTIKLTAAPIEFPIDQRASFKIGVEVENVGEKAVAPKVYETVLLVNGKRSMAWDLAVGNGPREEAWWNLEPGGVVTASWALGKALFPQPGDYDVVLRLGEKESSIRIRVTPPA